MRRSRRRNLQAGCLGILAMVAVLLAGSTMRARAEVSGSNAVSVTSTSQTITFGAHDTVILVNDSASANEAYARVFWCGETTAAATTSSPIRMEPGDFYTLRFNPRTEAGSGGYCAVSLVTAGGETATVRVNHK